MSALDGNAPLAYEEAVKLAQSDDPEVRKALAARDDLKPELLYFLAEDKSPEVRRVAAANEALPAQADLLLAKDQDQSVREGLAGKIAKLAPDMSAGDRDKIHQLTHQTLETLARDQLTRVRQILSDTLKDVAGAPPEVIKTLAMDAEIVVSGPVLENSPVLTDDDLLEIIETGPATGGLGAIARRREVSESVSDAVASTDDVSAIADLLSNPSAQIREETLDNLIEKAPSVELWHAPLVGRPQLPQGAATRLASFVADNLLDVLQQRTDLDTATLDAVKSVVHRRLGDSGTDNSGPQEPTGGADFLKVEPPIAVAKRLHKAGKLDEKVIGKALHASDNAFVLAALTVRAGVEVDLVKRIFTEKSAKGVSAVCWKAELPAKMAVQVQQRMARIAPTEVIQPRGTTYALSVDEMTWQIEFFQDLVAKGR